MTTMNKLLDFRSKSVCHLNHLNGMTIVIIPTAEGLRVKKFQWEVSVLFGGKIALAAAAR